MGGPLAVAPNGDVPPVPAERLGRAWRDLRRSIAGARVAEQVLGRPGAPGSIDPVHLDVLDVLTGRDGLRMSALAVALQVDPSTMTRTIHRMEAAGLARRGSESSDGRVVIVHVTPEGRRAHADAAARRTEVLDRALDELPAADRLRFVELFERFLVAVTTITAASEERPR